ncbi:Ferrous iron transport protein B [Candidatus Fokinia solitaria]|uniref:Ferrous iron transport protein B n=1 Tax=Candidatus Fokinia solitaria TaxID=1802984 RepID=A0A2U8BT37_9RICK|nr:ferrous iron transport protein B [Candidatus Fokinia solitaria]AWD33531.1 Ferrous iron transport protein B [Candidatus Fokinia solitaria]
MECYCNVALLGHPNSGKTTLMNKLSGTKCRTGNWFGVTLIKNEKKCEEIKFIDLPGTDYFPKGDSHEAEHVEYKVVYDLLESDDVDLYISVVDATNIKHDLVFTMELMMRKANVVVVVTKIDIAKRYGITIKHDVLAALLGCDVLAVSATSRTTITELKKYLCRRATTICAAKKNKMIQYSDSTWNVLLPSIIKHQFQDDEYKAQTVIKELQHAKTIAEKEISHHISAFSLFELLQNATINHSTAGSIVHYVKQFSENIFSYYTSFINEIYDKAVTVKKVSTLSNFIDTLLFKPIFALPIFTFLISSILFLSSLSNSFLSPILLDIVNATFTYPLTLAVCSFLPDALIIPVYRSFSLGLNIIVSFIPPVCTLYACLFTLEETGYMSRLSLLMNSTLSKIGIPGHAIIPLILSFGCNVPSIHTTLSISNKKSRIIAIMMMPFMSCNGRFIVFTTIGLYFFHSYTFLAIFGLYALGVSVGVFTAAILCKLLKPRTDTIILRLPHHTFPSLTIVAQKTYDFSRSFIFSITKSVFISLAIFYAFSSFSFKNYKITQSDRLSHSILVEIGKKASCITKYIGVHPDDWQINVALIAGIIAKEVIITTARTLYTLESDITNQELLLQNKQEWISNQYNQIFDKYFGKNIETSNYEETLKIKFSNSKSAFAFMIFVLLYFPCISVFAIIKSQIGMRWAILSFAWSTFIGYTLAWLCNFM